MAKKINIAKHISSNILNNNLSIINPLTTKTLKKCVNKKSLCSYFNLVHTKMFLYLWKNTIQEYFFL